MERLIATDPAMAYKKLNEWAFFGTHDSGAYDMFRRGAIQHALGDTFTNWAQCQGRSIGEQIRVGHARFLDLRVAHLKLAKELKGWRPPAEEMEAAQIRAEQLGLPQFHKKDLTSVRQFAIVHGPVAGPPLEKITNDIRAFLEDSKCEVLMVLFVPQMGQGMSKLYRRELLARHIIHVFGDRLYRPAGPAEWGSVADITRDVGSRIVAFFPGSIALRQRFRRYLCPIEWIEGEWINTSSLPVKVNGLREQILSVLTRSAVASPETLYHLQWTLTAQPWDTVRGVFRVRGAPRTIEHLAMQVNPLLSSFLRWMRDCTNGAAIRRLNIVTVDYEHLVQDVKWFVWRYINGIPISEEEMAAIHLGELPSPGPWDGSDYLPVALEKTLKKPRQQRRASLDEVVARAAAAVIGPSHDEEGAGNDLGRGGGRGGGGGDGDGGDGALLVLDAQSNGANMDFDSEFAEDEPSLSASARLPEPQKEGRGAGTRRVVTRLGRAVKAPVAAVASVVVKRPVVAVASAVKKGGRHVIRVYGQGLPPGDVQPDDDEVPLDEHGNVDVVAAAAREYGPDEDSMSRSGGSGDLSSRDESVQPKSGSSPRKTLSNAARVAVTPVRAAVGVVGRGAAAVIGNCRRPRSHESDDDDDDDEEEEDGQAV